MIVQREPGLPGWVGAADLVIAVSCSGGTQRRSPPTDEAVRRGAALVGIGAADSSPLPTLHAGARAVRAGRQQLAPRASLWALATPVLVAGGRLGLLDLSADAFEAAAVRLETVAETCRPDRESFVNPAKSWPLELSGSLPMVWGAGAIGGVAAYRFGCQLAENAKYPAVVGALPEAHHNQVVRWTGCWRRRDGSTGTCSATGSTRRSRCALRLLLLHDDDGDEAVKARVAVSERDQRHERGVAVDQPAVGGRWSDRAAGVARGPHRLRHRLSGRALGIDPTPVAPIDALKQRLA